MSKYFKLWNEIKEYNNDECLKSNREIINAYDLYNLLYEKFFNLKMALDTKNLEKKLDASLNKRLKKTVIRLNSKCHIKYDDNNAKLHIDVCCLNHKLFSFVIVKNLKDDTIDFNIKKDVSRENKNFYKLIYKAIGDNVQIISDKLNEFKDFRNLVVADRGNYHSIYETLLKNQDKAMHTDTFKDSLFNVDFNYNLVGNLNYKIGINRTHDKENIYYSHINNLTPLCDIVKQYEADILKKIPVEISQLDPILKVIVEESINKTLKKI